MSSAPVFVRWENTTPPHRKFYEIEVELSLFYPKILVRRWGRIDTRSLRSIRMVVSHPEELTRQMKQVSRRRERHGYRKVKEIHVRGIGAFAA